MNHYEKSILLKSNRQLFLVYESNKESNEKSLDFLVQGYENSVGLKAKVIPLKKKEKIQFLEDVYFQSSKEGWEINYHDQQYFLANKVDTRIKENKGSILKGSWNPYLQSDLIDFDMTEKALIVQK